jgi:hypothetical protein
VKNPAHLPENWLEYLRTTRSGLLERASRIGEATRRLVDTLLTNRQLDGLDPSRGVLSLAKKYGNTRLEAACSRALRYEEPRYSTVKNILVRKMDFLPGVLARMDSSQLTFRFAREKGFFSQEATQEKNDASGSPWRGFPGRVGIQTPSDGIQNFKTTGETNERDDTAETQVIEIETLGHPCDAR